VVLEVLRTLSYIGRVASRYYLSKEISDLMTILLHRIYVGLPPYFSYHLSSHTSILSIGFQL
jgi:hypothetical protein